MFLCEKVKELTSEEREVWYIRGKMYGARSFVFVWVLLWLVILHGKNVHC